MVSLEVMSTGFFGSRCLLRMAGLENLWSHFSLEDEEEHGAEVPKPVEEVGTGWRVGFSQNKR